MAWQLLVYRLPSETSRARVAVWRELRPLGALPLQQSVAAVPERGEMPARARASGRVERAAHAGVRGDRGGVRDEIRARGRVEVFRGNVTSIEAEEVEADLEMIRTWFGRVRARDLFDAPGRAEVEEAIARSEALLQDFVERAYRLETEHGPSLEPAAHVPWGEGT